MQFEHLIRHLVPAVLAGFAISAAAAPKAGPIDEATYRTHIAKLASDEFGGRKPGTEGEKLTLYYLESQFRSLGLKPGNGASFLQEVPMVEITAASDAALKFTTGSNSADLKFREDMVIWTKRVKSAESMEASPWSSSVTELAAPEYGWDDYAGVDMRGKTAVILDQRSRVRHEGRLPVPRSGNDLLRTLDLQVRGGGARGAAGRDHRSPDRASRVRMGHGREQLVDTATRSGHRGR